MLRLAPALLLLLVSLSGCATEERVRYWELETRLEWEGEGGPVVLEQGPHCSWLRRHDDGLALLRGWGDPKPAGHILGRDWGGDLPPGGTTGGGYDWWFGDGAVRSTVGGDRDLARLSWEGDVPVLDGERGFDGWNRTTRYEEQGWSVRETLTLRDHGVLPLTVRTERELSCE